MNGGCRSLIEKTAFLTVWRVVKISIFDCVESLTVEGHNNSTFDCVKSHDNSKYACVHC